MDDFKVPLTHENRPSIAIFDSYLLHATVHHPAKFQADTLRPQRVRTATSSLRPGKKTIMENFKVPWNTQKLTKHGHFKYTYMKHIHGHYCHTYSEQRDIRNADYKAATQEGCNRWIHVCKHEVISLNTSCCGVAQLHHCERPPPPTSHP